MFSKFKNRLKSWTRKVSKEAKTETSEEKPDEKIKKPSEKRSDRIEKKARKEVEKSEKKVDVPLGVDYPLIAPDNKYLSREIEKEKKSIFKNVGKIKITEKEFEVYEEELEMLLLENNVALEVTEQIIKKLKDEIIGKEFLKKEAEDEISETLKKIITDILIEPFDIFKEIEEKKDKPYVILFCGINGTGKTTTIAKIAEHLKKNGTSCILAAADTFRAASIEQLKNHGDKIGVKVISHEYGSDPASVGFDAIKYAEKNHIDCVLIDTAGRMHTEKNLIKEIEKISRVTKPDKKIFVGESITGNDAIEQVKSFDWAIGIDGIVLTKADIDEKGGTSLSLGFITKKPILFLGTGQTYDAIEPFDKEKFVERLGL